MSTDWSHTFSVLREPSFMLRTLSPPQGEMNPLSLIISRSLSIPPSMLHLKVRSALDTEGRASHLSADTRRQPRSLWVVSLRWLTGATRGHCPWPPLPAISAEVSVGRQGFHRVGQWPWTPLRWKGLFASSAGGRCRHYRTLMHSFKVPLGRGLLLRSNDAW